MDNLDHAAIGQRIKMLRKKKGLSQTELAQMLGKSLRTVQKYETGEIEVSISVINQIAECSPINGLKVKYGVYTNIDKSLSISTICDYAAMAQETITDSYDCDLALSLIHI